MKYSVEWPFDFDGLDDIVVDELELGVILELGNVPKATCDQVVHGDD